MLWIPRTDKMKIITNAGLVGSATPGTGVPSHATTADTEGTLTELISAGSNTFDTWGFIVHITGTGASATISQAKLRLVCGGATDDLLVDNLICGYAILGASGHSYFFPVFIPAGVRVAAALTSVRTGITSRVLIYMFGGTISPPWRVGRKVTTYGADGATASRGTALTVTASGGAATLNSFGNSSADHFAFLPGFQPETDTTITPAGYVHVGVSLGTATSDYVGAWYYGKDTGENVCGPIPAEPSYTDVPSGTQLNLMCSNSGANDAAYGGHIYAVS
jgi:hypothetical protein